MSWLYKPKSLTHRNNCADDLVNWFLFSSSRLSPFPKVHFYTSIYLEDISILILKCLIKLRSLFYCLIFLQYFLSPSLNTLLCLRSHCDDSTANSPWLHLPFSSPQLYLFPVLMGGHLNYSSDSYSVFLTPVRDVNVLVCLIKESSTLLYN